MSGVKRNIFDKVDKLSQLFPVVVILGVRQCGKTFLSQILRPSWKYFDLEDEDTYDRISSDMKFFFQNHPKNLIIDEAQKHPPIFNALRGIIDKQRSLKNRFLITGSSSPELISAVSQSLAGRAAIVELSTLKTNEIYSRPLSAFFSIFERKISPKTLDKLKKLQPVSTSKQVKGSFFFGGYPEPVLQKNKTFFYQWMDQYFKLYINRDIRSLFPKLDLVKYRRFIQMLGALSGQLINKAELARSLDISQSTAKDYLDIAHGSFIWRNLYSFESDSTKSMLKMPRGGFRDSGLLNRLLKNTSLSDLENHPYVGRLFENFVIEEVIKGISSTMATNWNYYYFRTKNGAEIDLILHGDFGLVPIEIKFGIKTDRKKLISLNSFINRHHLPFGLVINNASAVEKLSEKILQVPITFI